MKDVKTTIRYRCGHRVTYTTSIVPKRTIVADLHEMRCPTCSASRLITPEYALRDDQARLDGKAGAL